MDTHGITPERVNKNMLIFDSYSLFALCYYESGPFDFCVEWSTPTFCYGDGHIYISVEFQTIIHAGEMNYNLFFMKPFFVTQRDTRD